MGIFQKRKLLLNTRMGKDFEKEIRLQAPGEHVEDTCQLTQSWTKSVKDLINIQENLWINFTEKKKIHSRISALIAMDMSHLCPHKTTVVQEFNDKL